jgi:SAM-dependent methyltransferase
MSDDEYGVRDDEVALEARRLGYLAEARDPTSVGLMERCGIGPGWHCLEVGAGTGSVARWMAEQVGDDGRVMSTDIDLQFHAEALPNMIVRRHDIRTDPLPAAHFDLIHARAVLQHVGEHRAEVVDRLTDALKPGGWLVLEDGNFLAFANQTVPDAYRPLHELISAGATTAWRDPDVALKLLGDLRDRGYVDLDVVGDVWAMRPGEPGGDWWFLALERAGPRLVDAGLMTVEALDAAMAAVHEPGFVMMSTLSIAVIGRRPD